jgi:retron-type reverse transcriptase
MAKNNKFTKVLVAYKRTLRVRIANKLKMKRLNNLYEKIISLDNLRLADEKARKGKGFSYGVRRHDVSRDENIFKLHDILLKNEYKTSEYHIFKMITDNGKEREIYRLPYFPDRIVHHAIMNVMEPVWVSLFTTDTYSCIKGRGIHGVFRKLKYALTDTQNTQYCLKIDIRKFYPTIDHEILTSLIGRKIKDKNLLNLISEIISSAPGVPIGNYLSQFFANVYLSYFDHWIKEEKKVKYYFRYADDMVFLASDKQSLHNLFNEMKQYLSVNLKLEIKNNYQIFPVDSRGIDFVGYVFRHTHILMRKSIKKNFARKAAVIHKREGLTIADKKELLSAHLGWATHCNSKNLINKLLKNGKSTVRSSAA